MGRTGRPRHAEPQQLAHPDRCIAVLVVMMMVVVVSMVVAWPS